jgi:hypothetical protein
MYPGYNPGDMGGYSRLWGNLVNKDNTTGMDSAYASMLGDKGPAIGDAASGFGDVMPFVGTGLGLANSLATGQMQKHPLTTAGGLAGGLGGAIAGQMLIPIPGVGAAIGGAVGNTIGKLPGMIGGK